MKKTISKILAVMFALLFVSAPVLAFAEGEPPGPPPGMPEQIDEEAPVFTLQPEMIHFVYEGSGFAAPTFTVTAELPENSTATEINLQWYVSGEKYGEIMSFEDNSASSTVTVSELAGKKAGVYPVCCEAGCTVDDTVHTATSFTTNFIVCKGVLENSVLTFSDVHEVWDSIGQAIADTIKSKNGYIPALCVATGDYNNGYCAGYRGDYIHKCIETMIERINLQLGGIDTVWVSGNHDNGYATGFTNANKKADLGLDEENYYDVDGFMSGTGIIFNSRNAPSAKSSLANEKLIVIGVNYEDIGSQGAYANPDEGNGRPTDTTLLNYGTADSPENTVYHYLDNALKKIANNYNGELVMISTHAGLHMLGVDPDSVCKTDEKGEYSVRNSAEIVKLLNSYAEKYKMNIMFLFGHDHSRNEKEFYKLPGDTIYATVDPETATYEEIELKFSYGHSGYITSNINGHQVYSLITYDDKLATRHARVADGKQTSVEKMTDKDGNLVFGKSLDFTQTLNRVSGNVITASVVKYTPDAMVKNAIAAKATPLGYGALAYYDVTAKWTDGTAATETDIANNGGVTVTLSLPKDITSADDIIVLHKTDGDVEAFNAGDFIFTANGVKLKVNSLSPFAIALKGAPSDTEDKDENNHNETTAKSDTNASAAVSKNTSKTSPKTGAGEIHIVLLVFVVAGISTVLLNTVMKKKQNDVFNTE